MDLSTDQPAFGLSRHGQSVVVANRRSFLKLGSIRAA